MSLVWIPQTTPKVDTFKLTEEGEEDRDREEEVELAER